MEFAPNLKNLDDISKSSSEELTKVGFKNVNTTLASTIQALENAPNKGLWRNDINKIVEGVFAKGTKFVRHKMQTIEACLIFQAKNYATCAARKQQKYKKMKSLQIP